MKKFCVWSWSRPHWAGTGVGSETSDVRSRSKTCRLRNTAFFVHDIDSGTGCKIMCLCFSEANSESELDVKTILDYDSLAPRLSSAGISPPPILNIPMFSGTVSREKYCVYLIRSCQWFANWFYIFTIRLRASIFKMAPSLYKSCVSVS